MAKTKGERLLEAFGYIYGGVTPEFRFLWEYLTEDQRKVWEEIVSRYETSLESDTPDFQELRNQYPHLKDCPTKLVVFLGSLSQEEADQITEWFRRNSGNGS
jgi:hypothetical protein